MGKQRRTFSKSEKIENLLGELKKSHTRAHVRKINQTLKKLGYKQPRSTEQA